MKSRVIFERLVERLGIDPRKELNDGRCTLGALLKLSERPDLLHRNVIPNEVSHQIHVVNYWANSLFSKNVSVRMPQAALNS